MSILDNLKSTVNNAVTEAKPKPKKRWIMPSKPLKISLHKRNKPLKTSVPKPTKPLKP